MSDEPLSYMDTSAYLGVLLDECRSPNPSRILEQRRLCSSILMLVETERSLVRLDRENKLRRGTLAGALQRVKEDADSFILRDVTMEVCLTHVFPPGSLPKSGDLLHLRTALLFQREFGLKEFITLDRRQGNAAMELGLHVTEL